MSFAVGDIVYYAPVWFGPRPAYLGKIVSEPLAGRYWITVLRALQLRYTVGGTYYATDNQLIRVSPLELLAEAAK